jgi:hypothetical protein
MFLAPFDVYLVPPLSVLSGFPAFGCNMASRFFNSGELGRSKDAVTSAEQTISWSRKKESRDLQISNNERGGDGHCPIKPLRPLFHAIPPLKRPAMNAAIIDKMVSIVASVIPRFGDAPFLEGKV